MASGCNTMALTRSKDAQDKVESIRLLRPTYRCSDGRCVVRRRPLFLGPLGRIGPRFRTTRNRAAHTVSNLPGMGMRPMVFGRRQGEEEDEAKAMRSAAPTALRLT